MPDEQARYVGMAIIAASAMVGLVLRLFVWPHTTLDTFDYLLPWYEATRAGGAAVLGKAVTNYAPFYSYWLLFVAQFDGLVPPLLLIKSISFVFEFGSAVVAHRLAALVRVGHRLPALAFAAVWLAPSVIFNGALWGQSDAIWSFFVLLTVLLFCRRRFVGGMFAFALAVSVKAQAVFLGPLVLALLLRRAIHWGWLALIPAVYGLLALPTILLGRSPVEVISVYRQQYETFKVFSMNAANLWLFVPNTGYDELVALTGVMVAGFIGCVFAFASARRAFTPLRCFLTAAASLQMMPWLLPKMHERYFYAFEVMMIPLAFLDLRLTVVALFAQLNAVLSYLPYEFHSGIAVLGAPLAACLNTMLLIVVQTRLWTGSINARGLTLCGLAVISLYVAWNITLALLVPPAQLLSWWPAKSSDLVGLAGFGVLAGIASYLIIRVPSVSTGDNRPDGRPRSQMSISRGSLSSHRSRERH